MNVQFSLTASPTTSSQSKPEAITPSSGSVSSVSQTASIRNIKDMSLKEKQGVKVSVAEEQLIRTIERAVQSLHV